MGANLDIRAASEKNTKDIDAANAREIDNLLAYLSLCERQTIDLPTGREFNGAYLYGQDAGPEFVVDSSRSLREMAEKVPRWHSKYVMPVHDEDCEYELSRSREFVDWVGRLAIASYEPEAWRYQGSTPVAIQFYGIKRDGILADHGSIVVYRKGGRILVPSRLGKVEQEAAASYFTQTVVHLHQVETTWNVRVRLGDGLPAVGFFTDPTGVLQFLKFREIEGGRRRRDALVHWVAQHWRHKREDTDAEVYVREHLRGRRSIRWHGMECTIVIPPVEEKRSQDAIEGRKRLSNSGLAKRLKMARRSIEDGDIER